MRIQQEIHAANASQFKKSIFDLTNVTPTEYIAIKNKMDSYHKKLENMKKKSKVYNVIYLSRVSLSVLSVIIIIQYF